MNTLSNDTQQSINILAFDTSGDEASLALWVGGKMSSGSIPFGTGPHSQAACLFPMMQDLMNAQNLDFQDLHVIATPKGPGSFTGIRIGLAAAQGLILSTKAKCFAPSTFQITAFGAWRDKVGAYFVTIPTKRDSFYTQGFDESLDPVEPARIQTAQEVQEFLTINPQFSPIEDATSLRAENLILLYLEGRRANSQLLEELSMELPGNLRQLCALTIYMIPNL